MKIKNIEQLKMYMYGTFHTYLIFPQAIIVNTNLIKGEI